MLPDAPGAVDAGVAWRGYMRRGGEFTHGSQDQKEGLYLGPGRYRTVSVAGGVLAVQPKTRCFDRSVAGTPEVEGQGRTCVALSSLSP